jgi:predicted dehydrogenase
MPDLARDIFTAQRDFPEARWRYVIQRRVGIPHPPSFFICPLEIRSMKRSASRRNFLKTTAAASAGYWVAGGVAPRQSRSALEEIRFACIGIKGKGESDSGAAARAGKIVAMCDIDDNNIKSRQENPDFADAKVYHDYRRLFDELGQQLDAVTVSSPDHVHAVQSAAAMQNGLACFTQKPLTRTIWEARRLGEIARENGVVTQMGNQGSERSGLREAAAKIKAGVIGDVQEIHVWTNRPVWPQGIPRPAGEPIPEHLHWDEFIGPVEYRDYSPAYHPFKWRGFWSFGTGALGDMACHTLNMPFAGCDLTNPVSVQAITSGHNTETFPGSSQITFEFAATDNRPALKMIWYDGGRKPDPAMLEGQQIRGSGSLLVGTKGKIYSPDDYGAEYFVIGGEDKDVDFVRSPGHFREFTDCIRNGGQPWSNFPDYAGPLTEIILIGNLAVWAAGETRDDGEDCTSRLLHWDHANLKVQGTDSYDLLIKPQYRDGYTL